MVAPAIDLPEPASVTLPVKEPTALIEKGNLVLVLGLPKVYKTVNVHHTNSAVTNFCCIIIKLNS